MGVVDTLVGSTAAIKVHLNIVVTTRVKEAFRHVTDDKDSKGEQVPGRSAGAMLPNSMV